jgi:hypothetical protein
MAGWLLYLNADDDALTTNVLEYLREGERNGTPKSYKCRTRDPWYCVPHVKVPHAFLTYMNGDRAKLVANVHHAVAPNTLHCVRLKEERLLEPLALALSWYNSLTTLSCEVEGHSLGGGMLKLEPGEASRVLIPTCLAAWDEQAVASLATNVDALIRDGREDEAQTRIDQLLLVQGLGLTKEECNALREGAERSKNRRKSLNHKSGRKRDSI